MFSGISSAIKQLSVQIYFHIIYRLFIPTFVFIDCIVSINTCISESLLVCVPSFSVLTKAIRGFFPVESIKVVLKRSSIIQRANKSLIDSFKLGFFLDQVITTCTCNIMYYVFMYIFGSKYYHSDFRQRIEKHF